MGVDVGRGAGAGMAKVTGDNDQRSPIGDLKAGVCVPQRVDMGRLRQAVLVNKFFEPVRHHVGEDRPPVIIGKHPAIGFYPSIAQHLPALILPPLHLQEQQDRCAGNLHNSLAVRRFGLANVAASTSLVVPCLPDMQQLAVEINIALAQAQQLGPAQAG